MSVLASCQIQHMTLNTQRRHVIDIQTSSVSYLSKYFVDPPILTVISLKGVCASLRSNFITDLTEVLPRVALAVVGDEQLSGQGIFKQKSHSEWAATTKGPAVAFTAECTQSNLFGCYEAQKMFCFHLQQLALRHTGLKLQVLQALPNIELSLQLSASVALDLRSLLGTHSLWVAVGGMFPLSLVHAYFRGDEPWEVLQRSETVPPFSSLPSSQHLGGEGRTDRNQKKNVYTYV